MEHLLAWSVQQGAVHNLMPSSTDARVVVAAGTLSGTDPLVTLPQSLLLHGMVPLNDPVYGHAVREVAAAQGWLQDSSSRRHVLQIALILERCKQQQSLWAPYINMLPQLYDDPCWWQDSHVHLIRATALHRARTEHLQQVEQLTACMRSIAKLVRDAHPGGSCILDSYENGWGQTTAAAHWARSAVLSRAFTIPQLSNGLVNETAMVPVVDMLDHDPRQAVLWHVGADGAQPYQFFTLAGTQQGHQVFTNYGRRTSDSMLLAFGFMLPGTNPLDTVQLTLGWGLQLSDTEPNAPHGFNTQTQPSSLQLLSSTAHSADVLLLDDPGEAQIRAEALQRSMLLATAGCALTQVLSQPVPLPQSLVLGTQLCLLPATQLMYHVALVTQALLGRTDTVSRSPVNEPAQVDRVCCGCPLLNGMCTCLALKECMQLEDAPLAAFAAAVTGAQQHQQPMSEDGSSTGNAGAMSDAPCATSTFSQGCGGCQLSRKRTHLAMTQGQHKGAANGDCCIMDVDGSASMAVLSGTVHVVAQTIMARLPAACCMYVPAAAPADTCTCTDTPAATHKQTALADAHNALLQHGDDSSNSINSSPYTSRSSTGLSPSVSEQPPPCKPVLPPPAPAPMLQLQAASALHQHLSDRAAAMAGVCELQEAVATAAVAANTSDTGVAHTANPNRALHAQLASLYVQSKHQILQASDAALSEQLSQHLQAASAAVASAARDGLLSVTPLWHSAAPVNSVSITQLPASQGPLGGATRFKPPPAQLPPATPALCSCSSLDPETHLTHYTAWLARAQQPLQQHRQQGNAAPSQPVPEVPPSPALPVCVLAPAVSASTSLLLEVVCKRLEAGAGSKAGTAGETVSSAVPAPAGSPRPAPARRAPPTASRTFRMQPGQSLADKLVESSTQSAGAQDPAPSRFAAAAAAAAAAAEEVKPKMPAALVKRVAMPSGLAASLGGDTDHDPLALGVQLMVAIQPSQEVLRVSGQYCLWAEDRVGLVLAVLAAAARILQSLAPSLTPFLPEHAAGRAPAGTVNSGSASASTAHTQPGAWIGQQLQQLQVALTEPTDMLVWHLLHTVSAHPAVRLILSESADITCAGTAVLQEMMEDTPASTGYQEHWEELRTGFQSLVSAVLKGGRAGWQQAPVTQSLVQFLQSDAALPLYCWADSVVQQSAVQVHSSSSAFSRVWILAPVLCSMPALLRQAALQVDVVLQPATPQAAADDSDTDMVPAAGDWQPQEPHAGRSSSSYNRVVVCKAICALPAGLLLGSLTLLQGVGTAQVMQQWGPEALPWLQLLQPAQLAAQPAASAALKTSLLSDGTGQTESSLGAVQTSTQAYSSSSAGIPDVMYEMYLCPDEHGPLCQRKMALLVASGLGVTQWLTRDLKTEPVVRAALLVCMGSAQLLDLPQASSCLALYAQWQRQQQQSSRAAKLDAASSSQHGSDDADQHACLLARQLQDAQAALVAAVLALPDGHAVVRAATKQLKALVQDARKNTRRRLRQLEQMQAQAAEACKKSPVGAAFNRIGALGGSYHWTGGSCVAHEGVRLYMQGVCAVLDAWGEHLGLVKPADNEAQFRARARA